MKITQEPDRFNNRVVSLVAAVTIAVTVAGVLIAWGLLRLSTDPSGVAGIRSAGRAQNTPSQVSSIDLTLFRRETPPQGVVSHPRLRTYGFVEKEEGIIHVPLEQAMRLYLQRSRSRSSSPQAAPLPSQPKEHP